MQDRWLESSFNKQFLVKPLTIFFTSLSTSSKPDAFISFCNQFRILSCTNSCTSFIIDFIEASTTLSWTLGFRIDLSRFTCRPGRGFRSPSRFKSVSGLSEWLALWPRELRTSDANLPWWAVEQMSIGAPSSEGWRSATTLLIAVWGSRRYPIGECMKWKISLYHMLWELTKFVPPLF